MSENKHIWKRSIDKLMNECFAKYAKYIIQDRALPDIRDGLKPVQRRILYAMYDLGITSDKPYKKSARSVGEVIGKYHPHGDSSIYEAMVRMSQEWKNNIPLLDMHGNKGSIDGDNAAAMRYTECRLSKISELMLTNIHKNTIKFIPNFDDSEQEPLYLPSLIPNLLINGATGIAAGYATNIPPFNLNEVIDAIIHRIDYPNCSIDSIIKIMPGPDFPTNGIIQGIAGIKEAYETGKGRFIVRAEIEERVVSKKLQQLVITSIPYETNKSSIIKSIDDLNFNEKIAGIIEVRDESDKEGVCIVVDIEVNKSLEAIKNFLFKNTPLQITYAINFIAIHNRKPILMTILNALDAYINHALNILTATLKYDLAKAMHRLEIIQGLIKAISILSDVIATIRKSQSKEDCKNNIMVKFGFSEVQAEAIINLKLYRLSATDITTLKQEHIEMELTIKELRSILNSDELLKNYLKKILRGYKSEFGFKRRSKIESEIQKIVINDSDLAENKDVVVMVTKDGYLKTTTKRSIESSNYGEFALKSGDILLDIFDSKTLDQVICITASGLYISIPTHKIKNAKYKDLAEHINNIITLDVNDKIVYAFSTDAIVSASKTLLLCTKNGTIKRVKLNELSLSKNPKSSNVINLKDNDLIVAAQLLEDDLDYDVICLTKEGLGIRFEANEIPIIGRTSAGVRAQKINDNDCITACVASSSADKHQLLIISNRGMKRIHFNEIKKTKRANMGAKVMLQVKSSPYQVIGAIIVSVKDIVNVLSNENIINVINVSDVPLSDLSTRFNDMKLSNIMACYRDNWLSKDLNINSNQSTSAENNDDQSTDNGFEQGKLF